MFGALLICLAFDLGRRGYGLLSHVYLHVGFVAFMMLYSLFQDRHVSSGLFQGLLMGTVIFEILFVLPGWGLGLGARKIFGGGKPYSLKMSFEV